MEDWLVLHVTHLFFLITGNKLKPSAISKHFGENSCSDKFLSETKTWLTTPSTADLYCVFSCEEFEEAAGEKDSWIHAFSLFSSLTWLSASDTAAMTNGFEATRGQSDIIADTLQVKERAGVCGFLRWRLGDGS